MTQMTYKSDARSTVWCESDAEGSLTVVKRWEYSPLRQRLGWWLGLHPARRELRWNRRLNAMGLPVVPIIAHQRLGGRVQLRTPHIGPSLQQVLRDRRQTSQQRHELAEQLANMVADLFDRGLSFRDMKTSNLLLDDSGKQWWIDAGSFRRATPKRIARSLALLDRTAAGDGASRTDRLRCAKRLADRMQHDLRQLITDVRAHPHTSV